MEMSMARQPASQRYAGHEEAHSLLVPIPAPLTRLRSSLECTKDYIALCEEEGTKRPTFCENETAACIVNVVITNFIRMFINNVLTKWNVCFVNVLGTFKTNWNSSNWWTIRSNLRSQLIRFLVGNSVCPQLVNNFPHFIRPRRFNFHNFQPTNIHNHHLIHNNIVRNSKLLHISDPTGPTSGSTLILLSIKQLLNNILICCIWERTGGKILLRRSRWQFYVHVTDSAS
jgi:hypothetical protein